MCIDDSCMHNRMCTVFTRIVDLLNVLKIDIRIGYFNQNVENMLYVHVYIYSVLQFRFWSELTALVNSE